MAVNNVTSGKIDSSHHVHRHHGHHFRNPEHATLGRFAKGTDDVVAGLGDRTPVMKKASPTATAITSQPSAMA